MVEVLLKKEKKKENAYQHGSKLAYLLENHKENLTLRKRMCMSMDYTLFAKKQDARMYMIAGLEELRLS